MQRGERAVDDHHRVGDVEVGDLDLLLGGGRAALVGRARLDLGHDRRREHVLDLLEAQRHRLVTVPDEAGHRRGVPHGGPRLVGEVHADQDVTGEDGPLDQLALAVLDLRDLLGRDDHLVDVVLHVERGDPVLEVGLHPVLHAGVGVHHEPVTRLGAQRLAELLQRVGGGRVDVGLDVGLGGLVEGGGGLGRLGGLGAVGLLGSLGVLDRGLGAHRLGRVVERPGGLLGVEGRLGRRLGLEGRVGLLVVRLRHGYSVTFTHLLLRDCPAGRPADT